MEVIYGPINFFDPNEIRRAAEIHESAPLNWDPNYVIREEQIQKWCNFLQKAATDNSIFILSAKTVINEIIGLHWIRITEKYNERCAHIQSLWVSEKYRGHGIGRELKRIGEDWARANGAAFVVTEVFYTNKKMIDYNLKNGFAARQVEMLKEL